MGTHEKFLSDLRESIEEVKKNPGSGASATGSAPIYGSVGSLPPGPVKDVLCRYLDVTLS